jgi:hypothetical protein
MIFIILANGHNLTDFNFPGSILVVLVSFLWVLNDGDEIRLENINLWFDQGVLETGRISGNAGVQRV